MSRTAQPDIPIIVNWVAKTLGMMGCGYLMARLCRSLYDEVAYEMEYATSRQRSL